MSIIESQKFQELYNSPAGYMVAAPIKLMDEAGLFDRSPLDIAKEVFTEGFSGSLGEKIKENLGENVGAAVKLGIESGKELGENAGAGVKFGAGLVGYLYDLINSKGQQEQGYPIDEP